MQKGNIHEKAKPLIVYFVFSCIVVTTGLLYIMVQSEKTGEYLTPYGQAEASGADLSGLF